MNSNNSKINLIPYFNKDWYIQLDESFRLKLKDRIKRKYSIRELSNLTGKSEDSICKFHQGRYNAKLGYLLKICKLLNISESKLMQNIRSLYSTAKKGSLNIKYLKIDSIFAEWYGAWIGDGDHSPKRETIGLANCSINLLSLHMQILFRFGYTKNKIKVEVISPNKKESKVKIKDRWSKILDLPIEQISVVTYMENARQEGARVQVWCSALNRILHEIDYTIKSIIENSDDKIKIAYIRGIFAAEGSTRKKSKQIRLNMKNEKELLFARRMLLDLGIFSNGPKLNTHNGCFELSITGYYNIKRFYEINGFGRHKERSDLLRKVFKTYENKLPHSERFNQIKRILEKRKQVSNLELMQLLDLNHSNIAHITRMFVDKDLLKVDKSDKVYKYSLIANSIKKEIEQKLK